MYLLEINPNCGVLYPPGLHGSADYILQLDPGHGHMAFIDAILEGGRTGGRAGGGSGGGESRRAALLGMLGYIGTWNNT